MTPQEIAKDSGLKVRQVYIALHQLKRMSYVKTTMVPMHYINGEMVNNKTTSILTSSRLTEMNLKKKGVI